jgi:hypothetical protein
MATKKTPARARAEHPYVIVRTYSAGVYAGHLVEREDRRVVLRDAQIVHRWEGALSTLDLAAWGPRTAKLSAVVQTVEIFEVIAILHATEEARQRFAGIAPWAS